jgi:hypothetical protein
MKIKDIIQRIRDNIHPAPVPKLEDEMVLKFVQILENLRHEEMSCEEMYARLDEFVEREAKTHDAAKIMPLIREHIDMCPECCDTYEALLDIVEHTQDE